MGKALNKITILGSGTSTGIPTLTCKCPVCTSKDFRDKRLRTSIFLETNSNQKILIDTSPDLRTQLITNKIFDINSVIITHDHADHLHGIDDLRPFCFNPKNGRLKIFCSNYHKNSIRTRFPYIFKKKYFNKKKPILGGGIPKLQPKTIDFQRKKLVQKKINGDIFTFFHLPHNYTKTLSFIHEKFAYLPDCHHIPKYITEELIKIKPELVLIDCLQKKEHDTHLNIAKSFNYLNLIRPKMAGLIHMNHNLSHKYLTKLCKDSFDFSVFPVYDGLTLTYSNIK